MPCPECGHDIDSHGYDEYYADERCGICERDKPSLTAPVTAPVCRHTPATIARTLIDRAVADERKRLAQEVRYAASESQRRGELSAFDRLADEWEAGTDG